MTRRIEPDVAELPKVYIYPAGNFGAPWHGEQDVVMVALHEDGQWGLSHVCSSPSYGKWDLHDRRREDYINKFGGHGDGEFYHLVIVEKADDIPLATLVAAGIRNPDGSRPDRSESDDAQ